MDYFLQHTIPIILGDFIQNNDTLRMKTELFSGKVTLNNVQINPSLAKKFDVPLNIIFSNIGKIVVKVPWVSRLKQPIEVYLEDLVILAEVASELDDVDVLKERVKFLDMLTAECTSRLEALNQEQEVESLGSSSIEYYKALIIDNIQVRGMIYSFALGDASSDKF